MKTIIEMAREAGLYTKCEVHSAVPFDQLLEAFAALVRADERAQRTWVGLTDEEIEQLEQDTCAMDFPETARAIEAKLKEKNT